MKIFGLVCLAIIICLPFSGCMSVSSSMLIGGKNVKNYEPDNILVSYEAQGDFPEGSKFYLIEVDSGLAILQKDTDGWGMICTHQWTEDGYDCFSAAYFGYGLAFIYRIPKDRTKNAERYVYPNGSYKGTPGDRYRPMPYHPKDKPDAILIPM